MSSKRKRSPASSAAITAADTALPLSSPSSTTETSTKQACLSRASSDANLCQRSDPDCIDDVEDEHREEIGSKGKSGSLGGGTSPSSSSSNSSVSGESADASASATPTPVYSYPINPPPVGRPVRIYCDGIYDLFHFGHAKALEQAKKAFPDVYLLVGVCDDVETHKRKGKTVMTDKERYESVRHCKWVDEVIESAPWVVDQAFLDKHKIDYVAHDDIPYKSVDSDDVYAFVKKNGCFLPTQRTDGVSTSDLITRIVKDYDQYLRRNLERGVSAKDLGIGFLKEQEVKLKKSAQDLRTSIRQNWTGTKDELKSEIAVLRNDLRNIMNVWEDKSHEFVRDTFGVDSVVNKIFSSRRRKSRLVTDGRGGAHLEVMSSGNPSSDEGGSSSLAGSRDVSDSEGNGRKSSFWRRSGSGSPAATAQP